LGDVKTKKPDWLVKRLFEVDSLLEIYGDPETAKSLMAVDISCCVATGKDFHGIPVKQGTSIYLAGEGQNGLKRRFNAWAISNQVKLDNTPIFLSSGSAALCDPEFLTEMQDAIRVVSAEHGEPVLIIIDTLARNFGPGDENSTKDMTLFIASLDTIREQTGAAIMLVHHTGHADKKRARGAMALRGALDAEYRMEIDSYDTVRLFCSKMKDHQKPEPMAFEIHAVELGILDDDGEPITSAILDRIDYEAPVINKPKSGKWQKIAQAELDNLVGGLAEGAEGVLFDAWKAACLKAGIPRNRFHELKENFNTRGNYVCPS
jgi:hypothetical protein